MLSQEDKLSLLKSVVGREEEEEVFLLYLKLAEEKIIKKAYPVDPKDRTLPYEYEYLQVELAAYLLNNGVLEVPLELLINVIPRCGV